MAFSFSKTIAKTGPLIKQSQKRERERSTRYIAYNDELWQQIFYGKSSNKFIQNIKSSGHLISRKENQGTSVQINRWKI